MTEIVDQQLTTTHPIVQTNLVMQGVWLETRPPRPMLRIPSGQHPLGGGHLPDWLDDRDGLCWEGWLSRGWLPRRDNLRSLPIGLELFIRERRTGLIHHR